MFYFKIFLTHLDFRWRMIELKHNSFCGSVEQHTEIQNMMGSKIAIKKLIRHGKLSRVWIKKVS